MADFFNITRRWSSRADFDRFELEKKFFDLLRPSLQSHNIVLDHYKVELIQAVPGDNRVTLTLYQGDTSKYFLTLFMTTDQVLKGRLGDKSCYARVNVNPHERGRLAMEGAMNEALEQARRNFRPIRNIKDRPIPTPQPIPVNFAVHLFQPFDINCAEPEKNDIVSNFLLSLFPAFEFGAALAVSGDPAWEEKWKKYDTTTIETLGAMPDGRVDYIDLYYHVNGHHDDSPIPNTKEGQEKFFAELKAKIKRGEKIP